MASVHPSASPSGRAWLMTTKRWRDWSTPAISARPALLRRVIGWNLDLLQQVDDASAALDRLVEFKMQMRSVFQDDAFGEQVLKGGAAGVQLGHRRLRLRLAADDAD